MHRFLYPSLLVLTGCNGVLGIHKPLPDDLLYDAAIPDAEVVEVLPQAAAGAIPNGTGASGATSDQGAVTEGADDPRWAQWRVPSPKSVGLEVTQSYRPDDGDLVTDLVTHLQWQGAIDERLYTWNEATTYCASLSLPGGAFRLPTRIELLSIVDFTAPYPAVNADAFPDTPPTFFWTSSTYIGSSTSVWIVNFGPGVGFVSSSEQQNRYRVRCVRPGR